MRPDNQDMMDDLLVKLLAGEADADEKALAEGWINANEANHAYFRQFKSIWDGTEDISLSGNVSEDAAWNRLAKRIDEFKPQPIIRSLNYWIRIAAAFIIVGVAGFLIYRQSQPALIVNVNSMDRVLSDTLSDGSIITLNKNASLTYLDKFKGDSRIVELKGEAFFNVEPDKSQPFIVQLDKVKVTVLGTSFNIKNLEEETDIIVETGVVKVEKGGEEIELRAGERVRLADSKQRLKKEKVDNKLYNYYRSKEFVCEGTPLSELVTVLNAVYQTDIQIANPALKNLPLTAVFKDQPVEQILTIIAQTFHIRVEKEGNQFILR